MSMSLTLWKAPVVDDADEAKALLDRWYDDGDQSVFEPSRDIGRFAAELRLRYSHDPDIIFGDGDTSPWADVPFDQSDRLIDLCIRWSADNAAIAAIYVLARKHGLVLYDPQGPDIFLPTDPIEEPGPVPPPTAFEWFKGFAIAAVLIGLTYAAWLIPIGWVRWPAVVVAGFFAAAALFVVGAMIAGALGIVDGDSRS